MLELRSLSAGYGALPVLHAVDLSVRRGEIMCLLGANGAGKSTLAKTVAGLLRPSGGSVLVNGADIGSLPCHRRVGHGLTLVPETRELFPKLSVGDNLLLGAFRRGRTHQRRELDRVLTLFPALTGRRGAAAGTLSGGQQQMLAIARALMSAPRYLVLDEPSLGLAPLVIDDIMRRIRTLADDGLAVLLIEQNAGAALRVADTATVLERGRAAHRGAALDLHSDPSLQAMYLGGI